MVERLNTFSLDHKWVEVKINPLLLMVDDRTNTNINWFDTLKPIAHLITDIDTVMTKDIKSDYFSHYPEIKRAQFHYVGPNGNPARNMKNSPMKWAIEKTCDVFNKDKQKDIFIITQSAKNLATFKLPS
ncbi:unnamed protein product [Ambrosiozyma monospora]|uniref:Unnamed protein product n=1 Tax=Ambrosiozyma monospora TaxID=43982 RepID=A0ACB5U8V5_AMBMO|nr:unnamed protein product [Ambrosiozyma monospora]